jgi:hypothetical protein
LRSQLEEFKVRKQEEYEARRRILAKLTVGEFQ